MTMRHATVYALEALQGIKTKPALKEDGWDVGAGNVMACSWERQSQKDRRPFDRTDARDLLAGYEVILPTCPACATLLDLALEMRGNKASP
jgi:hypothetical protein